MDLMETIAKHKVEDEDVAVGQQREWTPRAFNLET